MSRTLMPVQPAAHGKTLMGGEPLIFHCNFYNYFLQKTLLLDETLGMEAVIRAAAAEVARGRARGREGQVSRGGLPDRHRHLCRARLRHHRLFPAQGRGR